MKSPSRFMAAEAGSRAPNLSIRQHRTPQGAGGLWNCLGWQAHSGGPEAVLGGGQGRAQPADPGGVQAGPGQGTGHGH